MRANVLFYLRDSRADTRWDGMGVAMSEEGMHFVDQGLIILKAPDVVWPGTGMVWLAAPGRWPMPNNTVLITIDARKTVASGGSCAL